MEELWNQLEGMHAAKQQILVQLGELYVQLEDLETQRCGIKNSINSLRSQLMMISKTYDPLKASLAKNLGLEDGVYDIDFANKRVVPNGQVSDIGNSQPKPDGRGFRSGSNGGDPNHSHSEAE